jgi:transcriptional regulator with XRE-family HTH domain
MAGKKQMASPFGQWLRKWRKSRGLTQVQLAQKAGCGQSILSGYERGQKTERGGDYMRPEPEMVERLATALGRPVEEARALAGYNPSPVPVTLKDIDMLMQTNPGHGVLISPKTGEAVSVSPDAMDKLIEALKLIGLTTGDKQ